MTTKDEKPGRRSGAGSDSVLQHLSRDGRNLQDPATFDRGMFTILVVDDLPASRYAAVRQLQLRGYKTREACDGGEALMMADASDAVLLDVNLPDINGVEVCRLLKSRFPSIPVVLISAFYVDDLHSEVGMSAGADAYLAAPPADELAPQFDLLLARGR